MTDIDDILWLLKDGKWHDTKEVTVKAELTEFKTEKVLSFLKEYNFIQVTNDGRIRIQPSIRQFLEEIQRLEKEELQK
ncbi:MAG: hypothetical protein NWF03_07200 [Candidatus Bathyarchaeota archaeon]|nr:hypothetical protein [Candidatus Bathyarchaeota archaeon]